MKKLPLLTVSLLATAGIVFLAPAVRTSAVTAAPSAPTNATGQALEIAPPVVNLVANPGQTIKTELSLRDVSTSKLRVTGTVNDFVAAGEDGTPKLLLEEGEASPYSLKGWVDPLPSLLLNPKEIKKMPVIIRVPANAAPGGYYGVVRFTATPPELEGTGVSLSASLGALVLLRVSGAAKESMAIDSFTVNTVPGGKYDEKNEGTAKTLFEGTPIQFIERIKNTGNVHQQPSGQVVIKNMFGKTVAAVNINLPPRNVLPSSVRKFKQPLDSAVIGNTKLFGKYTATLNVSYGTTKQTVSKTITFWVVPYKLIIGAILGLIAAFFILRALIRNYNKRIIKQARKRSRRR